MLKELVLTHWAIPITLAAMHMHLLNNQQLQWQPPNFNRTMATINMQIKNIYITFTTNKCSVSQLSVVNDGGFCNDDLVKCYLTELPMGCKQTYDCGPNIVTAGISNLKYIAHMSFHIKF